VRPIETKYATPECAAYRMILKAEAEGRPPPTVQSAMESARAELEAFEEKRKAYAAQSRGPAMHASGGIGSDSLGSGGAMKASDGWDDWGDWGSTLTSVSSAAASLKQKAANNLGELSEKYQDGTLGTKASAYAENLKAGGASFLEKAKQSEGWSGLSTWSSWGKAKILEAAQIAKEKAAEALTEEVDGEPTGGWNDEAWGDDDWNSDSNQTSGANSNQTSGANSNQTSGANSNQTSGAQHQKDDFENDEWDEWGTAGQSEAPPQAAQPAVRTVPHPDSLPRTVPPPGSTAPRITHPPTTPSAPPSSVSVPPPQPPPVAKAGSKQNDGWDDDNWGEDW